jgi:putative transposase
MEAGERDPQERVGFLCGGARPPTHTLIDYVNKHRQEFGVEPVCTVLS